MKRYFIFLLTTGVIFFAQAQCPVNEADFTNGGTFSGPCTVDYGGTITITGAVIWTGGTFTLRDADTGGLIIADGGSFTIEGGTITIDDADGGNDGFITVESGGTLTMTGGTLNIEEDLNVSGTVDIQSGATVNTTQNGDIDVLSGGSLTISGTINSNDNMTVSTGGNVTVSSGGTLDINNVLSVSGGLTTAGAVTTGNDIEINGGSVTVQNGGSLDSGDDIQVFNSGFLTIDAGGSASTSGGHGDVQTSSNDGNPAGNGSTGTIVLNGTLTTSRDIVVTDPNSFTGSGSISSVGGTMDVPATSDFAVCGSFPCSATYMVQILNAPSSTLGSFTITIEFGQDVTGFDITDIVVTNASTSNFTAVDGNTYTVKITADTNGDITINIAADVVNETNYAASQVTVVYGFAPGDVMIIGYSSESSSTTLGDGIAFVTLVDLPANQVLYMTDHEWDANNSQWINDNTSSTDTYYTWTNDASVLPAGSVVYFYGTADQVFTTVGGGSTTSAGTQEIGNVTNTNEVIYIYVADAANDPTSTVFLSALATDGFDGGGGFQRGDLPNTLTVGTTAIEFTSDEELTLYNGATDCNGTLVECQQQIANPANWVTNLVDNGSGGTTAVWPPIDGPVGSGTDFSGDAILPVELLCFGGVVDNQQVILTWATAQELENAFFILEKSIDGIRFLAISQIEGAGTTTKQTEYRYKDAIASTSIVYYRLIQVDRDGTKTILPTISIQLDTSEKITYSQAKLYPNPLITEDLTVELSGRIVQEPMRLIMMDLGGKIVFEHEYPAGTSLIRLNQLKNQLGSGRYILRIGGQADTIGKIVLIE